MTLLIPLPYFDRVIRLIIAVLCAVGLALTPVGTSAAAAAAPNISGCTMDQQQMPAMPIDHSKMDCCTPACQVAAAAFLPDRTTTAAPIAPDCALHDRAAAKELASFRASGLDPPPRLPLLR